MIRSPTVFEEVVKTVCTTNCTWSATVRRADGTQLVSTTTTVTTTEERGGAGEDVGDVRHAGLHALAPVGRAADLAGIDIGEVDLAEDAVQDAAEQALRTWPRDGVPDHPDAWLITTARRRAIDRLRRAVGTLSDAIRDVKTRIRHCSVCFNLTWKTVVR